MHGQRNSGGGDALIWDVCDAARVHEVCKARGEYLAAICGEEVISDEIGRRVLTHGRVGIRERTSRLADAAKWEVVN